MTEQKAKIKMKVTKKKILLIGDKHLEVVEKQEEKKTDEEKERTKFFSVLTISTELGFAVSLPIAGGALLGTYLDRIFQSGPKMTLSFIFAGVVIGGLNIYYLLKDSEKEGKRE